VKIVSSNGSRAAPGQDIPLTVLLDHGEPGTGRALRGLAGRLAARLGHDVAACVLDAPGEPLPELVRERVARGARRLVVLPLAPGQAARALDRRADGAIASVVERWPWLTIHRGAPLGPDDLARLLGERARESLRALGRGRPAPAEAVVVIVGAGGANPGANAELARLARLVYEAHQFGAVDCAFAELTAPSPGEAVARWARLGMRSILVVPCVVFAGRAHRRLVAEARAAAMASGVEVSVARPLSPHPALVWALARRHLEALGDAALVSTDGCAPGPYVKAELLAAFRDTHRHDTGPLAGLEARMAALLPPRYRDPDVAVSPAPMGAAPLAFDPDGAVAWPRMWQAFCELALAGGPPHRATLLEPVPREEALADPARYAEVLAELGRGIRSVTGLEVVTDGPPGWIGVRCASEEMAVWLMRAIVVENVMTRREGAVVYLPAGPRFGLDAEIRNVVTVVAKTHHYWTQHVAARGGEP
jgi:sirohydrochlorin cobaltochelatase